MHQSAAIYGMLSEAHLTALGEEDQRLLAATVVGLTGKAISEELYKSDRTVRAAIEKLLDLVCISSGVEGRSMAMLGLWFAIHSVCEHGCAARALEMILTDSIFPAKAAG